MLAVINNSWALLLGMFMLMIGNGLQGTLLGVRGGIEGYDAATMGVVMACFFVGFLGGSRLTPVLLRRVGHVRVFAAFASIISACFILYAELVHPVSWAIMRLIVGFCCSGVFVVAESWLNDSATNETRGQTLSAYLVVQMLGMAAAQGLLNVGDPAGYTLFVLISVVVSLSFAPILLSASPAPVFQTTRAISLREIYHTSPLGTVGATAVGAVFGTMFGMASVYGSEAGLTPAGTSIFVGAIYIGGVLFQFPIGWLSDRTDRRVLIMATSGACMLACLVAWILADSFVMLCAAAMVLGGTANPLYGLCVAHTNDYTENDQMAGTSAGLIFLNGIGAMTAPVIVGVLMGETGPEAFFLFIAATMAALLVFALYRATQRATVPIDETMPATAIATIASPVAIEIAQDWAIEQAEAQAEEEEAAAAT